MESVIHGVVGLTVTAIVFSQVLMPTLATGLNSTFNISGAEYTTNASAFSLWGTSQIIAVVGFIVLLLGVFGI